MYDTDPTILTLDRQKEQGFLNLPWTSSPVSFFTCFSTSVAGQQHADPFFCQQTPFTFNAQQQARLSYRRSSNCHGSFFSTTTTSTHSSSEHLSVAFGVTVGNDYLNASVKGHYDSSTLSNDDSLKSSQRASFRAGQLTLDLARGPSTSRTTPLLTPEAVSLLTNSGLPGFTARYGDYFVGGMIIGADAAVTVSQQLSASASAEDVQVSAEVQVLCFSDTEEVANSSTRAAASSVAFRVTAFDTLENAHVDSGGGSPVGMAAARAIGSEFAARVQHLARRTSEPLEKWKSVLGGAGMGSGGLPNPDVSMDVVHGLVQDRLVVEVVLLPFARLRDVQEVLALRGRAGTSTGGVVAIL